MSQQFRTVTTNAGRNAVREALTQGKTVKLSHMSVGDVGGNPVTPLSTMTKLVNERFRAQINDIVLDPATPDLFTAELLEVDGQVRVGCVVSYQQEGLFLWLRTGVVRIRVLPWKRKKKEKPVRGKKMGTDLTEEKPVRVKGFRLNR